MVQLLALHLLQAGRTDVQDTAYVSTGVSQSAHQSTQWHSVTAVISCSISRRSDALTSANDLSAVLRLRVGTLCLLLSSTVTLCLYLYLG